MGHVGGGGRQGLVVGLLSQEERKLAKDVVIEYGRVNEGLIRVAANQYGQRMGRGVGRENLLLSNQASSWGAYDVNSNVGCAYLKLLVPACKSLCVFCAVLKSATFLIHFMICHSKKCHRPCTSATCHGAHIYKAFY